MVEGNTHSLVSVQRAWSDGLKIFAGNHTKADPHSCLPVGLLSKASDIFLATNVVLPTVNA